jgi:hypothetical protein
MDGVERAKEEMLQNAPRTNGRQNQCLRKIRKMRWRMPRMAKMPAATPASFWEGS